jgi:hypothetical protein
VGGVIVVGVITFVLRRFAPRWPEALFYPIAAGRFVVYFVGQLVRLTWDIV